MDFDYKIRIKRLYTKSSKRSVSFKPINDSLFLRASWFYKRLQWSARRPSIVSSPVRISYDSLHFPSRLFGAKCFKCDRMISPTDWVRKAREQVCQNFVIFYIWKISLSTYYTPIFRQFQRYLGIIACSFTRLLKNL